MALRRVASAWHNEAKRQTAKEEWQVLCKADYEKLLISGQSRRFVKVHN